MMWHKSGTTKRRNSPTLASSSGHCTSQAIPPRDNSVWLVHPTVLPSLLQITVVIQNVAGTENVGGSLAAAVEQAPDGTLRTFGRPVKVTEACSPFFERRRRDLLRPG
jgi:hypothetical protein